MYCWKQITKIKTKEKHDLIFYLSIIYQVDNDKSNRHTEEDLILDEYIHEVNIFFSHVDLVRKSQEYGLNLPCPIIQQEKKCKYSPHKCFKIVSEWKHKR